LIEDDEVIPFKMTRALRAKAEALAAQEGITLNDLISLAIAEKIAEGQSPSRRENFSSGKSKYRN
jgi:hypothetical protein